MFPGLIQSQGTTFDGPLFLRDGGLVYNDLNDGPRTLGEFFIRVTITAAQMLALNATPITVIPAPGAGRFIEFIGGSVALDYNANAYSGIAAGEDLVLRYTNGSGVIVSTTLETTGFLDQTADQVRTFKGIATDYVPAVNAPIVLHMTTGEITTGDSPLYLNLVFRVHETGL
jgi:hypothetical protein